MISRTVLRFAAVGVANTCVGMATILVFKYLLGWSDVYANMVGYAVGLCVSFSINGRWTFAFEGDRYRAFARFLIVVGVAYAANLAAVLALRNVEGWHWDWAHLGGMVVYTIVNFFGSRGFVFADRPCPHRQS